MEAKDLKELNLDDEQTATVLGLINGTLEPESIEATERWIRQCYHRPSNASLVMHAIDATIETHGVEALGESPDFCSPPPFEYCNAGDTYVATIIRDNETGELCRLLG